MKQYHFYYSAQCRSDYRQRKPLFALIDGKRVEYTHCAVDKIAGGSLYHPDEKYLGYGQMVKK